MRFYFRGLACLSVGGTRARRSRRGLAGGRGLRRSEFFSSG